VLQPPAFGLDRGDEAGLHRFALAAIDPGADLLSAAMAPAICYASMASTALPRATASTMAARTAQTAP
jgi:hypothetical protein